ncbi:MAG: aminotransferase class V-fold PLP-dependent enzyme [Pirellulaceae bacterium]|nr:aminotransferase class V-fold PLP-dependent enzyme [Pirellulaceae bacterium]
MSGLEIWGVTPIINGSGTVTRLGGAPMPAAVVDAFVAATRQWAPLEQVQAVASRRIAAATGAEAGIVTAGSAAALTLGAAAILAGDDLSRMEKLPQADGFPNEFLVAREQRSGYDHAVRAAGARLVEVGFNEQTAGAGVRRTELWEFAAAYSPLTAGVLYVALDDSRPPLDELIAWAHDRELPVLVDAAGELPPVKNLRSFIDLGADLVCFSGGKAIRGPQATGILCGRRPLVGSAALQMLDMDDHYELWDPPIELIDKADFAGMPRHGVGRGLKVAKEQIAALLKALEMFSTGEYEKDDVRYRDILQAIADQLADAPVSCQLIDGGDGRIPRLRIQLLASVDAAQRAMETCRRLRAGEPPIYLSHGELDRGALVVHPICLLDEHAAVIARRVREEVSSV